MEWLSLPVTDYCERIDDSFWAEPLNAITNIAFILVAVFLIRRLKHHQISPTAILDIWLLIILIVVIGIGSFFWHTLATTWAKWLDITPILLYMSIYLLSFLHRIVQLPILSSVVWLFSFYAVNIGLYLFVPGDMMNGSIFYLPSLLILLFLTKYDHRLRIPATLFIIGITFRSVDQLICPWFSTGSHLLWHLSVSLVVLYTTMFLIDLTARTHK